MSGVDFWVLPNDFIIHQWHPYPSRKRNIERGFNRDFYTVFRQEICFREKMKGSDFQELEPQRKLVIEEACRELIEKKYQDEEHKVPPRMFLSPEETPTKKRKRNKKLKTE
jgi:hypothetical protein